MRPLLSPEEVDALLGRAWPDDDEAAEKAGPDGELSLPRIAPERLRCMMQQLRRMEVETSVELGAADIDLGRLSGLQVGEMILLDQSTNSDLLVKVAGIPIFKGLCRALGKRRGLEITVCLFLSAAEPRPAFETPSTIPLRLTVELGRMRLRVDELLRLDQGAVLELPQLVGEPFAMMVDQQTVAYGEVVVMCDRVGMRITEVVTSSRRERDR